MFFPVFQQPHTFETAITGVEMSRLEGSAPWPEPDKDCGPEMYLHHGRIKRIFQKRLLCLPQLLWPLGQNSGQRGKLGRPQLHVAVEATCVSRRCLQPQSTLLLLRSC